MKPTILVPFDFSPAAERALAWAVELQQTLGAPPPRVLHVINPVPPGAALAAAAAPVTMPQFTDEDLAEVERSIQEVLARLGAAAAIVEIRVEPGIGDAIVTTARTRGANLIVMGTHGRGGFARAVLGSVADYVIRHADCPVTTLRAANTR